MHLVDGLLYKLLAESLVTQRWMVIGWSIEHARGDLYLAYALAYCETYHKEKVGRPSSNSRGYATRRQG